MSDQRSRRDILSQAGIWTAAGAGLTLVSPADAEEGPPRVEGAASRRPASDRIQIGLIGAGGMGQEDMRDMTKDGDVDVVAIADPYDIARADAVKKAEEKGHKPKSYRDFRRLLDHKEIDAVIVATPDHWHALASIYACHAGKDVYVEKPLSYSIAEGRAMVNAARRFNRVTQMGTQVHATKNYRRVVEIVRSGILGEIGKVRVSIAHNDAPDGYGRPQDEPAPKELDYDLWLGPAPKREFNKLRFLFHFRWWWDYAGGELTDMGCHIIDLVYWALDLESPRTIMATGGRYVCHDICETPDTMEAVWEYAPTEKRKNPLQLVWSLTMGNARGFESAGPEGRGLGIAFYGSNATLVADYGRYDIYAEGKRLDGRDKPKPSIPPSPGHRREFLNCIKSRERCSCDVEYGHKLTTAPLTANIAYRTGLKLTWDPVKEQFINAPTANRLLTRDFRAPWSLPT